MFSENVLLPNIYTKPIRLMIVCIYYTKIKPQFVTPPPPLKKSFNIIDSNLQF